MSRLCTSSVLVLLRAAIAVLVQQLLYCYNKFQLGFTSVAQMSNRKCLSIGNAGREQMLYLFFAVMIPTVVSVLILGGPISILGAWCISMLILMEMNCLANFLQLHFFQIVKRSMSTSLFDVAAFLMSKSSLTVSSVLISSSDYFFWQLIFCTVADVIHMGYLG